MSQSRRSAQSSPSKTSGLSMHSPENQEQEWDSLLTKEAKITIGEAVQCERTPHARLDHHDCDDYHDVGLPSIYQRVFDAFRSPIFGFVLALLAGLVLGAFAASRPSRWRTTDSLSSWHTFQSTSQPKVLRPSRLYIQRNASREGIGSSLNRLKGSIILATHVLDATWVLGETFAHHDYYPDDVLNRQALEAMDDHGTLALPIGRICQISTYLPVKERLAVIRAVCEQPDAQKGPAWDRGIEIRKAMDEHGCTVILDDYIENERIEGLNPCYRDWVRARLGGLEGRRLARTSRDADPKALSIGIHIRWGDTAKEDPSLAEAPRGSMHLSVINDVIANVRKRFARLEIRLVMEQQANYPASIALNQLNFTDYTIIDSEEWHADLNQLADNDLLLLGASSYAALAHVLAPSQGLTIVDDKVNHPKFKGMEVYRPVIYTTAKDADYLSRLEELFPEVGRREG